MQFEDRVKAVAEFGFTERQARFLVTVMLHSGVCLLQSIFERAIDEGHDFRNPFRGIKRGKDKPRTRVLSLEEESKLLEALHPCFQRFVRFALGTGCRLDEIRGIDSKRDIDWTRGTVHVIGKFRKERDVPMQPDASSKKTASCGRRIRSGSVKCWRKDQRARRFLL
jgi:integrase